MTARALILNRSTNSARYTAPEIADLSLNNSKSPIYTSSSLESVNSSTNLWIGLSWYVGSFKSDGLCIFVYIFAILLATMIISSEIHI